MPYWQKLKRMSRLQLVQGRAHHAIGLDAGAYRGLGDDLAIGAPIVLEIIDAPLGIGVGVLLLVLPACR